MSLLALSFLCPFAGMNLGVSGEPSRWLTLRAPCVLCKRVITFRKGIFCANLFSLLGNWTPCQQAWCGECFQPLKGDRFPVRLPKYEEGKILVNEEDRNWFGVARPGYHLFCPFQCELCHFRNLQGRSPMEGARKLGDTELLKCLRRVNLDAFWSREPSTISHNMGKVSRALHIAHELGTRDPPPPPPS
jgi:hypothetical protein